jgi:peptidoglycan hydrolase-like protein with peptidoglycan-binding domain
MFLLRKNSVHKNDTAYIEQVKDWQSFLKKQGFDISIDGDFTDDTEKATMEFQKQHNLEVDGKAGPNTFAAADKLGFDSGLKSPQVETIGSVKLAKVKGSDKVSAAFKKQVIEIAKTSIQTPIS